MRELKILTAIVSVCVVGIIFSFGGSLWTAYKSKKEYESQVRPVEQVPVPAVLE